MKIIFFGTSLFAARVYRYLIKQQLQIVAVVTRTDKPKGRSLHLLPPPVKETCLEITPDIPLHQPLKASAPESADILKTYEADLFVVVAYGEIIKQNLLSMPRYGCINLHASLLPRYRGAAPMQRALMDGEKETGVTIIEMGVEMDAGDILGVVKTPIPESMNFGELDLTLSECGAPLLENVIRNIETCLAHKQSQDVSQVTFAPKLTAAEEEISWSKSATQLHNLIRALSPAPGAWCWVDIGGEKKRLKIKKAKVFKASKKGLPGETIVFTKREWVVACGEGALSLLEVQLEGKKSMPLEAFVCGLQGSPSLK